MNSHRRSKHRFSVAILTGSLLVSTALACFDIVASNEDFHSDGTCTWCADAIFQYERQNGSDCLVAQSEGEATQVVCWSDTTLVDQFGQRRCSYNPSSPVTVYFNWEYCIVHCYVPYPG